MNTQTSGNTTASENKQSQTPKIELGNFGKGRFSPAMEELYRDTQRLLSFSSKQAHVTASRLGVDAGQLSAQKVELAFGKSISKDGKRTLKEVTKAVKVTNSWAMTIGSVCSQIDDLRKQGLVVNEQGITMSKDIMEFVNKAAENLGEVETEE